VLLGTLLAQDLEVQFKRKPTPEEWGCAGANMAGLQPLHSLQSLETGMDIVGEQQTVGVLARDPYSNADDVAALAKELEVSLTILSVTYSIM
jgi:hypothetical protein